jgi:hypothetical protein
VPAPRFVDDWAYDLTGWRQLAAEPRLDLPAGLGPWANSQRERLAVLEAGWPAAADGQTLLHGDVRADNILVSGSRIQLVDWASTSIGAPWLDLLFFLPSVALTGGPDPEDVIATHPLTAGVDPEALTTVLAALTGFLVTVGMEPPPWYAPEVRQFQLAEATVALRWLRRRLGE